MTRPCCEHGLGLVNTPGVQGPRSPFLHGSLGRPRMAGRGWGKWHWRVLRDVSHTGWHMGLAGPNGSGSCRDRHLAWLLLPVGILGRRMPTPASPH